MKIVSCTCANMRCCVQMRTIKPVVDNRPPRAATTSNKKELDRVSDVCIYIYTLVTIFTEETVCNHRKRQSAVIGTIGRCDAKEKN
jgi:hypothetical protein